MLRKGSLKIFRIQVELALFNSIAVLFTRLAFRLSDLGQHLLEIFIIAVAHVISSVGYCLRIYLGAITTDLLLFASGSSLNF